MAHELDVNAATGRKAIFSVGQTPWHREGVILNDAPTFEDAMVLAGCNYEVVLRDLFTEQDTGIFQPTGVGKAVVRTDRNLVLGVVKERYATLSNRDAFSVLEPLLDAGVCALETGGTLRGGRDAWMMAKFNIKDPVVREVFADEVIPFALITNNHSGEARCLLMETPIRVVCANTLGSAVHSSNASNSMAVAHKGDARVRVVEAAQQMFGALTERYRTIADQYANMKATRLTVDQFVKSVLDVAAPLPPEIGQFDQQHMTSRGYDLAVAAAEKRRAAIQNAWHNGKGHVGDSSAWEAYNAAIEVIDHDAALFRTYGSRVGSLISGRLQVVKQKVANSVMHECLSK